MHLGGKVEISATHKDLKYAKMVVPIIFPFNLSVLSMKTSKVSWRMTVDY